MNGIKEVEEGEWKKGGEKGKNGKQNSAGWNIDSSIYSVSGISGVNSGGNSDSRWI